jgi:hypothetical protein
LVVKTFFFKQLKGQFSRREVNLTVLAVKNYGIEFPLKLVEFFCLGDAGIPVIVILHCVRFNEDFKIRIDKNRL